MIVDPDFCDHWKTRMLVGLLDNDESAPVYVIRLWSHCQNRRKARFENLPAEALKALCRFPGSPNKLEASLVATGFVRREGESLIVVGWEEYNATLIAAWQNGSRNGRRKKDETHRNDESAVEQQHSRLPTESFPAPPTGRPTDVPTGPRLDRSREDRSREEKKQYNPPTHSKPFVESHAPPEPLRLPPAVDTSRNREWLERWQNARKAKNGHRTPMAIWEPEAMLHADWSEAKWFAALQFSASKGSLSLLDPDDNFSKRRWCPPMRGPDLSDLPIGELRKRALQCVPDLSDLPIGELRQRALP